MIGIAIAGNVPTVQHGSSDHSGVLARAVHRQRRLSDPLANSGLPFLLIQRPFRRASAARIRQAPTWRGFGVRRRVGTPPRADADQGQKLTIKIKTSSQHAYGLERLVHTARIHRSKVGADRRGQTSVRIGDRYASSMSALHEAVTDNLDHHGIGFERADHDLTLRPAHATRSPFCGRRTALMSCDIASAEAGLIFSVWIGTPTTPRCSIWTAC